ncbi:MAG: serine hydrolase [Candidatus Daviesbacteria bacterium]|nr:serine hydrolase [Candidatus Daviesbacteria bacterium]
MNIFRLFLLIFLCASLLVVFDQFLRFKAHKEEVLSLKDTVENSLKDAKGTYGIVIKNFKTEQSYYLNDQKLFETGSLYKLWIMATVYKQIQDGKLTEDSQLSEDIAGLNNEFNLSPDEAELTEGVVNFTIASALTQMISISHNYAALALTKKIKLSSVAAFLKENGLNESSVGTDGDTPKSTPSDITLFYEKLYQGKLVNEQYSAAMIDLLKGQQLNDGLPKYLPEGTNVAHKTGDVGWFKHDAGIVYTEKGDYIIVAMSESDFPAGARERSALLSKAIYDFFQGN